MIQTQLAGSTGGTFLPTYDLTTNHYSTLPLGTPSYDGNGNLTSDGFHTYSWDAGGHLAGMDGTTSGTCDALGRRVEYGISGTYTQIVYDPFNYPGATMQGSTLTGAFARLPGNVLAFYNGSGLNIPAGRVLRDDGQLQAAAGATSAYSFYRWSVLLVPEAPAR